MGDAVDALTEQEGWRAESVAARVHYAGENGQYSVEYYEPSDCVLYWSVEPDRDVAVPIARSAVPDPLRERIRADLAAADVDPAVERREV